MELVAFWVCLHNFLECEVHPSVAIDKVSVECFAILQLDQHWVAYGFIE